MQRYGYERYAKQNRRRRAWQKIVSTLACIVVFCTTYALILPAITQEMETWCGFEEHTHEDECYVQTGVTRTAVCSYETLGVHTHSAACYDGSGAYVCGQADRIVHTHDSRCYDEAGALICLLPEVSQHVHTDSCYAPAETEAPVLHVHSDACYTLVQGDLICLLEEKEGHTHGGACYGPGTDLICANAENHVHGEGCYTPVLSCGISEGAGHTHGDSCYGSSLTCTQPENHVHGTACYTSVLICEIPEEEGHAHAEACYAWNNTLTCGMEEGEAEPTEAKEPVLVCTEPVLDTHIHSDSCFETTADESLTCTLEENEEHQHSKICYGSWELVCELEEHTHELACFSNPEADLETAEIWEATFADVELTGEWYQDVLLIAESQLGYSESVKNYVVWEDGSTHGYTRYGEWYGIPHGDWCGMFVSFCLNYAGVEGMPLNFGVRPWIEDLTELELYHEAAGYDPIPGELIFFDWEGDGLSDHVGLVAEIIEATETEPAQVKTIEGNSSNMVQYVEYDIDDPVILGYSELPEQEQAEEPEYFCGLEVHTHADACYDEAGNLVCTLAEHVHSEECLTAPVQYYCGLEEHTHGDDCYGLLGILICDLEEHTHTSLCQADLSGLLEDDRAKVANVIELIDAMPSADEIDAKIAEFEEAEDYEGEEAWLTEVYQQVGDTYLAYYELGENLQPYVINAEKLLELEYIWSMTTLAVTTARPTIYQINSYDRSDGTFDGDSPYAVMLHGSGTVKSILDVPVTWIFNGWYAVFVEPVTEDGRAYYKVSEIITPGSNLLDCSPPENGYLLLFYQGQVIPTVSVGNYVTIHFTVPASGAEKTEGYGTVSFSTAKSGIYSDAPTKISSASTSEFVELNLYDYNGAINSSYWNAEKNWWYPGFQWNGGAYKKNGVPNSSFDLGIPDYNADRNMIDSIDFGNSLITNLTYGGGSSGDYTKAINATNVTKTSAYYSESSPINWIYGNEIEDYTNKPIGTSTTDLSYSDVMKDTLVNGYPAMFDGTMLDYLFKPGTAVTKMNTANIDGLFQYDSVSGAYYFNSRTNHAEYVEGENRFQLYDEIITPNFLLYPFGNFLPLNTIDDSSKATQVSAFNYSGGMRNYVERIIADLKNDAEGLGSYWNGTQRQLATMLEEYQENWTLYPRTISGVSNNWENLSAANAIRDFFWKDDYNNGHGPTDYTDFITGDHLARMYNIDWDVQTNFFFGMEMKMNFYQPKEGMTGTDTDGDGDFDYPMEFYFTGDDDVWVYIDDVLFLDLSGIHRHVGGEIDFVNGKVYYYALDTDTGDVSSKSYATYTFKQILEAAGASTADLNDKGTFKDYTTHSFNFYYTERGSGSSVCRLNFNFPLLRQNSLAVEKKLADDDSTAAVEALGNPDFLFQVLDADDDSLFLPEGWAYSLYDVDGSVIQEITVNSSYQDGRVKSMVIKDGSGTILCEEEYDSDGKMTSRTGNGQDKVLRIGDDGSFALKAGQKAEFVGIPETWGKYYVRELLEKTVVGQYDTITVSGTVATMNDVTYGGIAYTGAQSPVLDMTNGSSVFRIENKIATDKLGKLSISKKLDATYSGNTDKTFKFSVTLDGKPLPEGTTYTVGNDTKEVTVDKDDAGNVAASYVEIAPDQTATISNILAGTTFEVTETTESAKGYTVSYGVGTATNSTSAKGVVGVDETVAVTVTNSEIGTSVNIPIAKTMSYFGNASRSYEFTIEQVADQNGTALNPAGYSDTVPLDEPTSGYTKHTFKINYTQNDVPTNVSKTFYYKVSEVEGTAAVRYDTKYYIVKVDVTNTNDVMTANVTDIWQVDGTKTTHTAGTDMTDTTILFTNTILRKLIVSKTVTGTTNVDREFTFTLTLVKNDSNAELPTALVGTKTAASGNTSVSYPLVDGVATFTLKNGESVKFTNIPYRSKWTLTETAEDGYLTTYTITANNNTNEYTGNTAENQVANAANTTVAFTNAVTYSLPETGGAGTTTYTMAGLMLMLCSVAYLLYRYKKRRREDI